MTDAENSAIKRQVYFERVKNERASKVLALLDDADKRIAELLRKTKGVETRKRYNEIAKAIKALAKTLRERIAEGLDTEEIIDSELDAQRKFITDFCGVKIDNFTLPTTRQVLTAAEFAPIVGSMTYQSYLDGIETGLFNAWDSAVRTGYLTGETTQSIVKRVLGSAAGNAKLADAGEIATLRNSVWRNTRTALQSFARETRDAVYEANADIFSGYKFLATLDKRTCPVCGALDGKIYKRLEDVPKVPLHYNCRCIALGVVKGFDFSDTRASMNGQVDSKVTYEQWLRAQPADVQKDVLGTTRYKLWRAGEPLGGFVDNGKLMTVGELREKLGKETGLLSSFVDKRLIKEYGGISGEHSIKADADAVNPKGYARNCQECVLAYEMRRRGIAVQAKDEVRDGGNMFSSNGVMSAFKKHKVYQCQSNTRKDLLDEVMGKMKEFGDGARAVIRIESNKGLAHVYSVEQVRGSTFFVDSQNASMRVDDLLYKCVWNRTILVRMDNLTLAKDAGIFVEEGA